MADMPVNFTEIRALAARLPDRDDEAATAAATRLARITAREGTLDALADAAVWLAGWQGKMPPDLRRPRLALFAAGHGHALRPELDGATPVVERIADFTHGEAAAKRLAGALDAELKVYDLAADQPGGDAANGPSLTETDAAHAMAYGMMAVEPGLSVLSIGSLAPAAGRLPTLALLAILLDLDPAGLAIGAEADWLAASIARHRDRQTDPLGLLAAIGGREHAAMLGALLAARLAKLPTILEDRAALAAALILARLDHRAAAHARPACQPMAEMSRMLSLAGLMPLMPEPGPQLPGLAGAMAIARLRLAAAALESA